MLQLTERLNDLQRLVNSDSRAANNEAINRQFELVFQSVTALNEQLIADEENFERLERVFQKQQYLIQHMEPGVGKMRQESSQLYPPISESIEEEPIQVINNEPDGLSQGFVGSSMLDVFTKFTACQLSPKIWQCFSANKRLIISVFESAALVLQVGNKTSSLLQYEGNVLTVDYDEKLVNYLFLANLNNIEIIDLQLLPTRYVFVETAACREILLNSCTELLFLDKPCKTKNITQSKVSIIE